MAMANVEARCSVHLRASEVPTEALIRCFYSSSASSANLADEGDLREGNKSGRERISLR